MKPPEGTRVIDVMTRSSSSSGAGHGRKGDDTVKVCQLLVHRAVLVSSLLVCFAAGQRQSTFHAIVHTVAVYATVRDAAGHLITDLTAADFHVKDDGRPAAVSIFSNSPQPITAVVMLDVVDDRTVPRELQAARALIAALHPSDRLRLGTIGGSEINLSPHLTNDPTILETILREEMWFALPAPLSRGIDMAMTSLAHESGRRVVLVLEDFYAQSVRCLNCGTLSPELRVIPDLPGGVASLQARLLREPDYMLYAIGFLENAGAGRLARPVVGLAELSGGGHFDLAPQADLAASFAAVADELRHQYVIGFTPTVLDGREHRLEVSCARHGAIVRARASYIALGGS